MEIIGKDTDFDTVKMFSRSYDGLHTWTAGRINIPEVNTAASSIEGVSASTAYAALYGTASGTNGGIWITTDSGANWTSRLMHLLIQLRLFLHLLLFLAPWMACNYFSSD